MSEATKNILFLVSNAFHQLTDDEGDLNELGMKILLPIATVMFIAAMWVMGESFR